MTRRTAVFLAGLVLLASCVSPPTEEERIQAASLSFLEAERDRRFDEAWDRLAETARHNWEALRDEALGKRTYPDPLGLDRDSPFGTWAKQIDRNFLASLPRDISTRDFFLRLQASGTFEAPPDPLVDPPEISTDGDHAAVWFPKSRVRVFLHREEGRWRVEIVGDGDFAGCTEPFRWGGADGKRFVSLIFSDIRVGPAKEVPLPRVPGARVDILALTQHCVILTVDENGSVYHWAKLVKPEEARDLLAKSADLWRDIKDPSTHSKVFLGFRLHRDLSWGRFRDLLRTAVSVDIRFRDVLYAVSNPRAPEFPPYIPTRCEIAYPRRVRCWMPEITVELRAGPGKVKLLGALCDALRKQPEERFQGGIRVVVDPRLRMEDVLRAWAAMGAARNARLWIEPGPAGGPPGKTPIETGPGKTLGSVLLDGKALSPDPHAPSPPILGEKQSISLLFPFD